MVEQESSSEERVENGRSRSLRERASERQISTLLRSPFYSLLSSFRGDRSLMMAFAAGQREGSMAGRLTWTLWLIVAAALAVVGLRFLWVGSSERRAFRQAALAVPADFAVDLALAGTYAGPIAHTHRAFHGMDVELVVEPPFSSYQEAEACLADLRATLVIGEPGARTDGGVPVDAASLSEWPWSHTSLPRRREPHEGSFFRYCRELGAPRNCEAVLTVQEPARGLEGRSQRLAMQYALCGIETDFAPMVCCGLGGLLLLPGLVTGIIVARRRMHPPNAGPSAPS
jgi:hypothetical protein